MNSADLRTMYIVIWNRESKFNVQTPQLEVQHILENQVITTKIKTKLQLQLLNQSPKST